MKEAKNLRRDPVAEFKRSFEFDERLFPAAVRVGVVYCDALFQAGILTRIESERIKSGLQTVLKRADFYQDYFDTTDATNIFAFIETRLVQLIGETGAKINIGRSLEDQTLTAVRLWMREEIEAISKQARDVQTALIDAGERQKEAVFPTYAHGRLAQPILWAHWCLAYYEMLARDRERLEEVWRRVNVLPLGAADLIGTAFEIDREEIARALGFEGVSLNSLDAAADADFAVEASAAFSLLMLHLARLAEDLMTYNAPERGFVRFSGALSETNDNLDFLELVRAKAAAVFGWHAAVFTLTKSLPLGTHEDFQEIEKSVFESVDQVKACLPICSFVLENLRVDERATRAAVRETGANAAELNDYLTQRNFSVKTARELTDKIVRHAAAENKKLEELSLEEFRQFSEHIGEDVFAALSLENALASKNQIGGTAPERVHEALEQARENLEREK